LDPGEEGGDAACLDEAGAGVEINFAADSPANTLASLVVGAILVDELGGFGKVRAA
jgi:hypothetical protein